MKYGRESGAAAYRTGDVRVGIVLWDPKGGSSQAFSWNFYSPIEPSLEEDRFVKIRGLGGRRRT